MTSYEYEYEFVGNGAKIKGTFTQKVAARDEANARRTACGFAKSKAHDPSPVFVRLVASNDPRTTA